MSLSIDLTRIFEDGTLLGCSLRATGAYLHLLGTADHWGHAEYNVRVLWGRAFAGKPQVTERHVRQWLKEYEEVGLLKRYVVGRVEYLEWSDWKRITRGRRRVCRHPAPPWADAKDQAVAVRRPIRRNEW